MSYDPFLEKPKVLVGVIGNDAARFHIFTACVLKLDVDGIDANVEMLIGGDWCAARNDLARMTLEGGYTHLWFMDDDHAFSPSLLKMLLRHDQALVNPLCLARIAPFPLVTYAGMLSDGSRYLPLDLAAGGTEGLVELEAGGCAGMLIRRDVLEAIPEPWFEYTNRSEDIVFCEKAKAAGFTLYADLEARLGHITTAVVWPAVNEGEWKTAITVGRDLNLFVKLASEWEEVADEATAGESGDGAADPVPAASNDSRILEPVERIEMWFVPDELRWYGRALDSNGFVIAFVPEATQEAEFLAFVEAHYPGVPVFQINSDLEDSRTPRQYGPPQRLWSRQPKEEPSRAQSE